MSAPLLPACDGLRQASPEPARAVPAPSPIIVLKLGSSVLRDQDDLPIAVHEVYRWWRLGYRVVVVVSAFAGVTDRLAALALGDSCEAHANGSDPQPVDAHLAEAHLAEAREPGSRAPWPSALSALAILIAAGERRAAGLLALELEKAGVPAQVLDPAGIGLTTRNGGLDAEPAFLDRRRVERALEACPIAVLPGFQAVDLQGAASLLGRGGSDLTAVFVAQRLGARCRLIKDVPGVFDGDPALATASCRRFPTLSWRDAAALDGGVVQPRALAFAHRRRLPIEVAAPGDELGTLIGPRSNPALACARPQPLRVAILGLGTVGLAVYRRLARLPSRFTVTGIAVLEPRRRRPGVPPSLLTDDPWALLEQPADIVVEALPGLDPAARLLARSLALGRDLVSANKAALAATPELWTAAHEGGCILSASAAVGGAVPVLETASRLSRDGRLEALHGVLNGTCNFVLDRLEEGRSMDEAVTEAQRRGLAEVDPTSDLDGSDAACKLVLVARAAFGVTLDPNEIARHGFDRLDPATIAEAATNGRRVRQVASLSASGGQVRGTVGLVALPEDHFLAGTVGEENRALFERRGERPVCLAGKGAGGRPTAEAVASDLLAIWRLRSGSSARLSDRCDGDPPGATGGGATHQQAGAPMAPACSASTCSPANSQAGEAAR